MNLSALYSKSIDFLTKFLFFSASRCSRVESNISNFCTTDENSAINSIEELNLALEETPRATKFFIDKSARVEYLFTRLKSIIPLAALLLVFTCDKESVAQVVPDNTLGTENTTIRSIDDLRDAVEGGAIRGDNLFHSFEQFAIQEGFGVEFANPEGISNIFSRVTGGNISEILGTLSVDGNANLFLMNPNGIVFGENAAIDVGGSFIATTATSIDFNSGDRFSAIAPDEPLLTIDFPVGLGLGTNSGDINVSGSGHELRLGENSNVSDPFNAPITGSTEIRSGLNMFSEKTLALIGNNVSLNGGIVANPSGDIKIGGIESGTVGIELSSKGATFDYSQVTGLGNIVLDNSSLLDTSGLPGGSIDVKGKKLSISENSLIVNSNFGSEPSGDINIEMSGAIEFVGVTSPSSFLDSSVVKPGIISQTFMSGKGSDINLSAEGINLSDFSQVNTIAYGSGDGGNINLDVDNSLAIEGTPPIEEVPLPSGISTVTTASGAGGNISLEGKRLSLQQGGLIISQALQKGSGGNIDASFTESVNLSGAFALDVSSNSFLRSTIGTTTVLAEGGNLAVETAKLKLGDGARINATTSGTGSSGDIDIDATTSIQIEGEVNDSTEDSSVNYSQITASSEITNPSLVEIFGLPPFPEGDAGSIVINTSALEILDKGTVTVQNQGTGNAGNLEINANSLNLDNAGEISASTLSGEGGNITLNAEDLELANGSQITATAGGAGDGGNITIDTSTLVGSGNSDITVNAFEGDGGNIEITAEAIIGIESRDRLTPFSDITADSELGIDGTVNINSLQTNADDEVAVAATQELGQTSAVLEYSCLGFNSAGKPLLTIAPVTTRETPDNYLDRSDEISIEVERVRQKLKEENPEPEWRWQPGDPIVEPNAVETSEDGSQTLVVAIAPAQAIAPAGVCQKKP